MHACHSGSCFLLPPFPGHGYNGYSVFMSLLNCIFPPMVELWLCADAPRKEKEGQAANLELAGRE